MAQRAINSQPSRDVRKYSLRHDAACGRAIADIVVPNAVYRQLEMTRKNQQSLEQPPTKIGLSFSRGQFRSKPFIFLVPGGGVEPPRSQGSADFESAASASSAIPAHLFECTSGRGYCGLAARKAASSSAQATAWRAVSLRLSAAIQSQRPRVPSRGSGSSVIAIAMRGSCTTL